MSTLDETGPEEDEEGADGQMGHSSPFDPAEEGAADILVVSHEGYSSEGGVLVEGQGWRHETLPPWADCKFDAQSSARHSILA